MIKLFDSYRIRYFTVSADPTNELRAIIDCDAGGKWVVQMQFWANAPNTGGGLGTDVVVMYYALERFSAIVDILRHDSPLAISFDTDAKRGELYTYTEEIGETEIVQLA
ncbi:hypothetical protein [Actinomycetospora aeridis]|uniref:Uncharacterized protein n=1 Tax=Actinomycetospora aeridis TaxID=3129231 RepID=A0ABU8NB27_9PSEU